MPAERLVFDIEVAVRSPFSFADVDAAGIGIDTPALRSLDGEAALLPARHLKGLLREGFRALLEVAEKQAGGFDENELFGPRGRKDWEPERGALLFEDLTLQDEPTAPSRLTRIEIDDEKGTVTTGMLQVVELAAPPGQECKFRGRLIWHSELDRAGKLADVLTKALRLVPYFGGMRTAGFGEHVYEHSKVEFREHIPIVAKVTAEAKTYRFQATFDRPIAVDITQLASNVFASGAVVPGSTIKGALADMLRKIHGRTLPPEIDAALAAVNISHAFPVGADGKLLNRALPASIVQFLDAGQKVSEFRNELGRGKTDSGTEPEPGYSARYKLLGSFLPDMKPKAVEELSQRIGRRRSEFPRFAYGHTAISAETGTAETGQLFVVVAQDTRKTPFEFTLTFETADTSNAEILGALISGLDSVGKTNARMAVTVLGNPSVTSPSLSPPNGLVYVLLETDAPLVIPDPAGNSELEKLAREYFRRIDSRLELKDCYLRHRIAGGYQSRRPGLSGYAPTRLLTAGSCFAFDGTADTILLLQQLARSGLPVFREKGTELFEVTDWRECLFLRQNGFGAISINSSAFDVSGALS